MFDAQYIHNFCPPAFDAFEFLPSVSASGGIITIWKLSAFEGSLAYRNNFAISVDFRSLHNNAEWLLEGLVNPSGSLSQPPSQRSSPGAGTRRPLRGLPSKKKKKEKKKNAEWLLTNVYGPCKPEGKRQFTDWLKHISMPGEVDWLLVCDFNLMRSPANRKKPGGDLTQMYLFNETISSLGLVEYHCVVDSLLG
jgi:hypothetical protein